MHFLVSTINFSFEDAVFMVRQYSYWLDLIVRNLSRGQMHFLCKVTNFCPCMKMKKFFLVRFCLFVFRHTHTMLSFNLSPVVQHHVEGIVYEVADGEADEGVAGGGEGDDQVVLHLRSLQVQLDSQTGQLEDNPTTDRRCNYRLRSVPAVGRVMEQLYKEEY